MLRGLRLVEAKSVEANRSQVRETIFSRVDNRYQGIGEEGVIPKHRYTTLHYTNVAYPSTMQKISGIVVSAVIVLSSGTPCPFSIPFNLLIIRSTTSPSPPLPLMPATSPNRYLQRRFAFNLLRSQAYSCSHPELPHQDGYQSPENPGIAISQRWLCCQCGPTFTKFSMKGVFQGNGNGN